MSTVRRDLGILQDRRFVLLLAARTISMLGSAFAPVALAFGVLALPGATATTLSAVLTAEALPMVALMLVGGVLADRLPRHWVIAMSEGANAAAYSALAVMMLTGWTPLPALIAASAASGIAGALLYPALTGIIPEVVSAERLQAANALIGLGGNSARVAGLVLSGGAVVLLGAGWSLAASGAMFAVAGVLVALLRQPRARGGGVEGAEGAGGTAGAGRSSVLADLREGWREFVSRQWLWVVVAQFSMMVLAIQAAHGVLGPLIARDELGGAPAWSAVLAGEALGMIFGVVVSIRLRPRRPILVGTLLTLPTALPYVALGVGAPLWMIVAGAFVMGVCFDVFGVLWSTTLQREIPPESLSRVGSYDALGSLALGPIGLMLAGPAAVLVGPHAALLGCAAIVLLVSLAALLAPGVRNLRAPDGTRATAPADAAASPL
ncbi:MFS transporter [Thermopolyspora sp. NPDC052614]|uniref:MFS transporter n=1 Tax=Thermopolyspora sp. NPDC052614 TaxID=3155682 RepID=UPI00343D293C